MTAPETQWFTITDADGSNRLTSSLRQPDAKTREGKLRELAMRHGWTLSKSGKRYVFHEAAAARASTATPIMLTLDQAEAFLSWL